METQAAEKDQFDRYGFRRNPIKEENLSEGEVLCDVCNGNGYVPHDLFGKIFCKKCQGCGKLDWVERIVGKKEIYLGYSGYTAASGWPGMSACYNSGGSGYINVAYGSGFSGSGYVNTISGTGYSSLFSNPPNNVNDTTQNIKPESREEPKSDIESKKDFGNKIIDKIKKFISGGWK